MSSLFVARGLRLLFGVCCLIFGVVLCVVRCLFVRCLSTVVCLLLVVVC